ncbi:unnamed protein product [Psylliodes chrysocephalus]|uniref:Mutator-like transposase domain-containing protein n=1 Tax=Psylliodes chrysocephalus TaxID=3402493 RepID=A0A9P0CUQ5_9CUCU|nr:unnamed protein product [Psylliodes chrysocephala]
MSQTKYNKCHISDAWEQTASKQMAIAAKEEADYAKEIGQIDKNGIPLITVVADGCWSKRSYRSNYNALSGAATIIRHRFGKVLYLGVKNKICSICLANNQIEHKCYKNYTGTSTGMESTILLEEFKHGIKYAKLISDGDSSKIFRE